MPVCLFEIVDINVVLTTLGRVGIDGDILVVFASVYKEKLRHFLILNFARILVQTEKSKFDFFVSGSYKIGGLFYDKIIINAVEVLFHNV